MTGTVLAVLLAVVLAAAAVALVRRAQAGRGHHGPDPAPLFFEILAPPSPAAGPTDGPRRGSGPRRPGPFGEVRETVNLDSRSFLTGAVLRDCACERHEALR